MRNCRLEHAALIADRLAGLKTYAATLYLLLRYRKLEPPHHGVSPRISCVLLTANDDYVRHYQVHIFPIGRFQRRRSNQIFGAPDANDPEA